MSLARDGLQAGSAESVPTADRYGRALPRFFADTAAIADMEVQKLRHDPQEVLTRAIQPVLWLVIFGQVMANTHAIATGDLPYIDYLSPGILAQSALFVSIFYGIAIIWDRDLGVLHKFLVSPSSRVAQVSGKATAAGVRSLVQGAIVYLVAAALGVNLRLTVPAIAGVILMLLLGAALFATFSLIIACVVKTRERFMGMGQVLTMPLFFASSAIYPIALMPGWLQAFAHFNPLTYQVDALRTMMLAHGQSVFGLPTDFAVMVGVLVVLVAIAAPTYPRVIT